jgi:hypothetical protein
MNPRTRCCLHELHRPARLSQARRSHPGDAVPPALRGPPPARQIEGAPEKSIALFHTPAPVACQGTSWWPLRGASRAPSLGQNATRPRRRLHRIPPRRALATVLGSGLSRRPTSTVRRIRVMRRMVVWPTMGRMRRVSTAEPPREAISSTTSARERAKGCPGRAQSPQVAR